MTLYIEKPVLLALVFLAGLGFFTGWAARGAAFYFRKKKVGRVMQNNRCAEL